MTAVQAFIDYLVSRRFWRQTSEFSISSDHAPASVLTYLGLLSRTNPSLPGLARLDLYCPVPTPEAASLLSSSLLHHPAIEALHAPHLSWALGYLSTPATAIFRTLPQLTALKSLTLSAPFLPLSPPTPTVMEAAREAVQAMAAATSALPRLACFSLYSMPSASPNACAAPPRKRPRSAACICPGSSCATPPSLDPVIAALSTAPALTALTFELPAHDAGTPLPCRGILGPFRTLKRLVYDRSKSSIGTVTDGAVHTGPASLLHAEGLPALRLLTYAGLSPCPDGEDLQMFVAAAACLKHFQHNAINLGPDPRCRRHVWWGVNPTLDPQSTSWHVHITTGVPAASVRILVDGLATSTSKDRVSISWSNPCACMSELLESAEGVTPFLQPLRAVTQMRCLDLSWPEDCSHTRVKDLYGSLLAVPLGSLTQLTKLCLRMPLAAAFRAAELAHQLATLTELQSLCLPSLEYSCVEDFRACIAPFTALIITHLCVHVRPVTAAVVQCFAKCVAGMPFIDETAFVSCDGPQFNNLASCQYYSSDDWTQGVLDLPCRGFYQVIAARDDIPAGEVEVVRQQLIDKGAEIDLCDVCFDVNFKTDDG